MATTDINGMVFYTVSDPVEPLQTVLNGISTATTNALNSNVRLFLTANTTTRAALAASRGASTSNPLVVYRQDVQLYEYTVNGSTWLPWLISQNWTTYTPAVSGFNLGNGTLHGAYARFGRTIHYRVYLIWGSTTTATSGAFSIGLPVTCVGNTSVMGNTWVTDSSTGNAYVGVAIPDGSSSGSRVVGQVYPGGTSASMGFVQPGLPFTWAVGDIYSMSGTYETP